MKKLSSTILITFLGLLSFSCSNNDKKTIDYLAVKLIGSEAWSIVDLNTGEIKYKDEFINSPSIISNDIFSVKNGNGTYDFYNINNVKTPINDESYFNVLTAYYYDVIPVVKKGQPISLIDTDCKEIVVLDPSISICYNFSDNLAAFSDINGKYGFINKKGEIEIRAQYDNATFFSDGISLCTKISNNKKTIHAIDEKGNELFSFDETEYTQYGHFNDGILPVVKGEEIIYLNNKGEKLYSLCNINKNSLGIDVYMCGFKDDTSVFIEGDLFGLKDSKNNIILRAKYESLYYIDNNKFIARKEDKSGVIDCNDNIIIDFKYANICNIKDGIYLAGSDDIITIIDEKGKDKSLFNFSDCALGDNNFVTSNYIDPKSYATKLSNLFTTTTFLNYNGNLKVKDFKEELGDSPISYENSSVLELNKYEDNHHLVWFDNTIARETFSYFYGYQFHDGWAFNYDSKIKGICKIYDLSEFECVEDLIAIEFDNILKERGYSSKRDYIYESNDGTAVCLSYSDGNLSLYYYFKQGQYIDPCREVREKKNLNTPQGIKK